MFNLSTFSGFNWTNIFQDNKSVHHLVDEDNDERESLDNGRDGMTGTPDSANSRNEKELEELMDVEHHQVIFRLQFKNFFNHLLLCNLYV